MGIFVSFIIMITLRDISVIARDVSNSAIDCFSTGIAPNDVGSVSNSE